MYCQVNSDIVTNIVFEFEFGKKLKVTKVL